MLETRDTIARLLQTLSGRKEVEAYLTRYSGVEAHRFAITFHRQLKGKSTIRSSLDSIPGVGPKKKKALIGKFGSPRGVKLALVHELEQVDGITPKLAQAIFTHFEQDRAELIARDAAKREKAAAKAAERETRD